MDTRRAVTVLVMVFAAVAALLFMALLVVAGSGADTGLGAHKAGVGVVELTGEIHDSRRVVADLHAFLEDADIRAVVLRVDSPGGAVGPSQEIRSELIKAREQKHVVASLGSVAASGGYYAALGCEKIYTNPGTLTGSIGVIMQHPVLVDLMKTAHVDMQTYTSGPLKDSGSPFRLPNPADRTYLLNVTREIAAQFVDAVAESRNLSRDKVEAVADGRVVSGRAAVGLGLVDAEGTLFDAAKAALELAGDKRSPRLVYPKRPGQLWRDMMEGSAEGAAQGLVKGAALGGFEALWRWGPAALATP